MAAENVSKYSFKQFRNNTLSRMGGGEALEKGSLTYWRARILFALIATGLVLGFFSLFPVAFLVINSGLWQIALFDMSAWLIGFYLLFSPRLSYNFRAGFSLMLIYFVGLFILANIGPLSGGPFLIFAFAVLSGVLMGARPATAALILNAVTIFIVGWLMATGRIGQSLPFFKSLENMFAAGMTFILSNAMATMSVSVLVQGLVSTSQKERSLTDSLEAEQSRLLSAKKDLEIEVEDRRSAEKALRESEKKYRDLFKYMPIGLAIVGLDNKLIDCNDAIFEPGGYNRADLQTIHTISELFYDPTERNQLLEKLAGQDYLDDYPVRLKRNDGTPYHVLLTLRPITIKGQTCWHAMIKDITDRIKAESALRKSEKRQNKLIKQAFDIIYETDATGIIKSISKTTEDVFGVKPQEMIGARFIEFVHPSDRERVTELFLESLQGKKLGTIQMMGVKADQSPVTLESRYILESDHGNITGTFGVIRDITEKKRLEEQLQSAKKMEAIGTLAGGIAHDFNNLLMGIQGRNSLVMADMDTTHPHFVNLQGIEEHVKSAANLTKQLLGFARGGKYEVNPTRMDHLLKKSTQMFGRTRKEISIHTKLMENLWVVEVDRGQIEQVLLNIYVNAWHSMPEGGDLFVEASNLTIDRSTEKLYGLEAGNYVRISITDTGIGMDREIQGKIFDPFFTTKEMGRGTGLGLASAYGIIQNHNGNITVDSQKGRGTTFSILLPASAREVVKEMPINDTIQKGQGTVLMVDDEEIILDVGVQMLEAMGYQTLIAQGGEEAVRVYSENKDRIDMIILDMIMPGMNGSDTFKALKEIDGDVKVILSSGYSLNGQATEILDMGCIGFIQKPFSLKELSGKLKETIV